MTRITAISLSVIVLALLSLNAIAALNPDELILYWSFDDKNDKQATDISGRNHHGTITAGKSVKGKIGSGLEFDGAATFIELAHHDDFNLPDGYTIALWAQIDDLPHDHIGLPRKQGSYIIHPSKSGNGYNFHTYVYTPGGTKLVHADVIAFGDWHYLAGTYDSQVAKSWVDSQVIIEQKVSGQVASTPNEPLRWSNDCCGGRMLKGILDEIVIVNRALNEAEMKELMEKGFPTAVSPAGKLASTWGQIKK
jgi:hypothetical protein